MGCSCVWCNNNECLSGAIISNNIGLCTIENTIVSLKTKNKTEFNSCYEGLLNPVRNCIII